MEGQDSRIWISIGGKSVKVERVVGSVLDTVIEGFELVALERPLLVAVTIGVLDNNSVLLCVCNPELLVREGRHQRCVSSEVVGLVEKRVPTDTEQHIGPLVPSS